MERGRDYFTSARTDHRWSQRSVRHTTRTDRLNGRHDQNNHLTASSF